LKAKEDIEGIKKGENLPKELGRRLLIHNREMLDVPFINGIPQLSKDEQDFYGVVIGQPGAVISILQNLTDEILPEKKKVKKIEKAEKTKKVKKK